MTWAAILVVAYIAVMMRAVKRELADPLDVLWATAVGGAVAVLVALVLL